MLTSRAEFRDGSEPQETLVLGFTTYEIGNLLRGRMIDLDLRQIHGAIELMKGKPFARLVVVSAATDDALHTLIDNGTGAIMHTPPHPGRDRAAP